MPDGSASSTPPATEPTLDRRLLGAVEAVLLAFDKRLNAAKLAAALGLDDEGEALVERAVEALNDEYERSERAFRIERVGGGFRVMTLPEYAGPVAAVRGMRDSGRLSRAAVETLAVVAYRQPITRGEIEAIRGVGSGEVLRTLLDKGLIAIAGRAKELGRPILYGTSQMFLEVFGLESVKDLPPADPDASIPVSFGEHVIEEGDEPDPEPPVPAADESAPDDRA